MLFITNRFPKGSIQTKIGRKFEFDLKNNAPSNSVFFCNRADDGSITEVGGMNFLSDLKKSEYRQILLYIHGFSRIFRRPFFRRLLSFRTFVARRMKKKSLSFQ